MKKLIAFLLVCVFFAACGSDNNGNSSNGEGFIEQSSLAQKLSFASNIGDDTSTYRRFKYRVTNGVVRESLYLRVLQVYGKEIEVNDISINGVLYENGSIFDTARVFDTDILQSNHERKIRGLFDDFNEGREVWKDLEMNFIGGTYVIFKDFDDDLLAPFERSQDVLIPVIFNITVDGQTFNVTDSIKVPGSL